MLAGISVSNETLYAVASVVVIIAGLLIIFGRR